MIYLLKSNDKLKIGYTKDFNSRLKQYKLHNPDIEVIACKDGIMKDEQILHSKCLKYEVSNEWYKYCDEVISEFNNYVPLEEKSEVEKLKEKIEKQNSHINSLIRVVEIFEKEKKELKYQIERYEKTIEEYKQTTREAIDLVTTYVSAVNENKLLKTHD